MPVRKQTVRFSSLLLLVSLVGCSSGTPSGMNMLSLTPNQVTSIQSLQEQQRDPVVYLQGQVSRQVPLVKQQAYELQDSTGRVWVVTQKAAPQPGSAVLIKGKVRYQSIPIGNQDLGEIYIEEQQQL